MKKRFSQNKYKFYNKKHSIICNEQRKKFLLYRKRKRKGLVNPPRENKYYSRASINNEFITHERVFAPEYFDFLNNTAEVIKFLNKLEKNLDKKKRVFVVLKNVVSIDYGAIIILLSIMFKFKSKSIRFNGDFPINNLAKEKLTNSGFFKCLYGTKIFDRHDIEEINTIHTHSWTNVDSQLSANVIKRASNTIWGEEKRCQGVQRTLLELMQNTNNHASYGIKGEKHWWLHVNHSKENETVSFSFIDLGIGIFKSLNNKPKENKFYGWLEKFKKVFGNINSNSEILKLILEGELHKTVTKKNYRGLGLPGINETLKRNQISKLFIISNNVFANVEKNEYIDMDLNFSGTFVFWELNKQNKYCNG